MQIKALVLWQPWASLIAIGAKPFEFRNRDYRLRDGVKVGDRIAIAAAARPVKREEVNDLVARLDDKLGTTGLIPDKASTELQRWLRYAALIPKRGLVPPEMQAKLAEIGNPFPLRQLVCTATLGEPKPSLEVMPKWKTFLNDSDRLEHSKWAWPMLDVRPTEPIASRGGQGFFWVSV